MSTDEIFLQLFLDTINLQTDALSEYSLQKGAGWEKLGEYAEQIDDLVDKAREDINDSFAAETIANGIIKKTQNKR